MLKLAQEINTGQIGIGFGRLGDYNNTFTNFDLLLSAIIGFLTVIAGIWFIFIIVIGGIALMSSGGDKGALEEARKRIFTGLIGLVVVIAGIFIANLIGYFLGLNILNPSTVIQSLY